MTGCGAFTKNGNTQLLVTPEQLDMYTVMLCVPGPTIVPAGGDWEIVTPTPQAFEMQGEFDKTDRFGTTPWHAFVVSNEIALSCRQPQLTLTAPPTSVTAWVAVMELEQAS